jgi:hypothetical protein
MTTVPNSVPDEMRCDHLILLVGGNPLPNAVSGHLLVKPGGRITLIYSEGTLDVARRLADWLRKHAQITVEEVDKRLCVREQEPVSIYKRVQHVLDRGGSDEVGLNYTGGTKTMAVHAYRAVEVWAKVNNRKAICSYLDARAHRMILSFLPSGDEDEIYVGDKLKLNLDQMLDLHNWQKKSQLCTEPILPKVARVIANSYTENRKDGVQPYSCWKKQDLYYKCRRNGQWKCKEELQQIKLAWPNGLLSAVADALKEETGQVDQEALDIGVVIKKELFDEPIDFCKWLDGNWLEDRVLDALLKLPPELKPQSGQAFRGVKVETVGGDFELDVLAILGYQLFGFTCGTKIGDGAKKELKLKLFEGLPRTRQIGGDQARTALVCVYEDPDGLQAEARQQIDPDGQIRVFGLKHLANLEHELAHWIRSQRKQP